MRRACLLACVPLAALACVDHGPGPARKKIEYSYIRSNLLTEIPAGVTRVDVDLGGKVVYVGTRLTDEQGKDLAIIAPGGKARITHYWQVKQPIGKGWRIFRFLRGGATSSDFLNLDPTDMEIGHPVYKWKAGQIIQDVQDIVLRPDWRSQTATLHVGLVADEGHQLGDRMNATGATVVDRAAIARVFDVDLSKAPPPPGTIHVPRAAGPITIDGIATDAGWSTAATSTELITADGSPDPVGKTIARLTWDDENLYVFVQVTDTDVYSSYKVHDEPIWKQDCVEMFIDADGNRRGYVELQVNPNNTTFDSFFATTRSQPGDEKWTSNMVTSVQMRGTADKGGDKDVGWDVEIAIPLAAVKGNDQAMNVQLPPKPGDRWRLNVVRVDYRSNGGSPAVSSWNRIGYGDFHALDRMLTIVFADVTGATTPGAQAPVDPTQPPAPGAPTTPTPVTPSTGSATPTTGPVTPPTATQPSPPPRAGSAAPGPAVPPSATALPISPLPITAIGSGGAAAGSGSAAAGSTGGSQKP